MSPGNHAHCSSAKELHWELLRASLDTGVHSWTEPHKRPSPECSDAHCSISEHGNWILFSWTWPRNSLQLHHKPRLELIWSLKKNTTKKPHTIWNAHSMDTKMHTVWAPKCTQHGHQALSSYSTLSVPCKHSLVMMSSAPTRPSCPFLTNWEILMSPQGPPSLFQVMHYLV